MEFEDRTNPLYGGGALKAVGKTFVLTFDTGWICIHVCVLVIGIKQ